MKGFDEVAHSITACSPSYLMGWPLGLQNPYRPNIPHYVSTGSGSLQIRIKSFPSSLVRETLKITRNNSGAINKKISSIRMANIFLQRGMFWFGFLLLIQVIWYILSTMIPFIWPAIRNVVCNLMNPLIS
jgi:hypothetical protein